jgi:hypothetical protein
VAAYANFNEGDVEEVEKFQDFVNKVYLLLDYIIFADMSMNVAHLTYLEDLEMVNNTMLEVLLC